MSRLSLRKRLLPARKAWKTFTTKLQTKLNKLQRSKAIKKSRKNIHKTQTTNLRSSLSLYFPLQRKRRLIKPSLTLHPHYYRSYLLQKRPAPVYIDDLFKQPDTEVATTTTTIAPTASPTSKGIASKKKKTSDKPGTSSAGSEKRSEKTCIADDIWESMGLASPQMHGIDARAEDFIARFRAEMELQEMMARNL